MSEYVPSAWVDTAPTLTQHVPAVSARTRMFASGIAGADIVRPKDVVPARANPAPSVIPVSASVCDPPDGSAPLRKSRRTVVSQPGERKPQPLFKLQTAMPPGN